MIRFLFAYRHLTIPIPISMRSTNARSRSRRTLTRRIGRFDLTGNSSVRPTAFLPEYARSFRFYPSPPLTGVKTPGF
jgi:hypothetical protein